IMEMQAFGLLLTQLSALTAHQCAQVQACLGLEAPQPPVGRLLDQAAQPQLCCPRCHATRWYRHGRECGLQRYRCRAC
ncbi:IS1 family transposase, partial [Pseudoduganella ginsengisoli]|nr:IS1595 family transposase [Pseudoduganella ginsengisoli]